MGASCTSCSPKNNYESIYKEFFDNIRIRSIPQADWSLIMKGNTAAKKINDKKWEGIMIKNLSHTDNPEVSSNLFRKVMNLSENKGGQFLILLSLLFLCQKNASQTKKEFEDLGKILFGLKNDFKEENNIHFMRKEILIEIVRFYVMIISNYSIDVVSNLSSNKKDFEEILFKIYAEETVNTFIEEEIVQEHKLEEWINLDIFFDTKYPLLNDDSKVREKLYFWFTHANPIVKI